MNAIENRRERQGYMVVYNLLSKYCSIASCKARQREMDGWIEVDG